MGDWVEVKFEGWEQLQEVLERFPEKLSNHVIKEGLTPAAEDMKNAFIAEAPDPDTKSGGVSSRSKKAAAAWKIILGHLKNRSSWRFKWQKKPEMLAASVFIGPSGRQLEKRTSGRTKGLPRTAAMIARWVELGSATRNAYPFMTRAWEGLKMRLFDNIAGSVAEGIEKAGK